MDLFITKTCSHDNFFATSFLKNWIDLESWKARFHEYENLNKLNKYEIKKAIRQDIENIFLRVCQEVCVILFHYLRKIPSSSYQYFLSIFARNESQKDAVNLSHINLILEVQWIFLTESQRDSIKYLTRA